MSTSWPRARLGEVLTHYDKYIESPESRLYSKLSVKLYGKGVVMDTPADGATLKMNRHQLAKAGQVILSEIWGKKGAIGFVPPEGEGALCTSHFFLFDVDAATLHPKWLKAIFDANYLQQQLDAQAKGTTGYAAVRPKILLACEIPLPPLTEQKRIVARIDELATKIQEARVLRQQADEEAETLILRSSSNIVDSLKCERKPLGEVAYKRTGVAYKAEDFADSGDVPVVRLKEIGTKSPSVFLRNPDRYDNVWLDVGDIILAKTSFSTGAICLWPGPRAVLNQNAVMLRAKDGVEQRFLFAWLRQQVSRYLHDHLADPSFYPYIREADLVRWLVPIPLLPDQHRIVAYLDDLQERIDALKSLQAETSAELSALIPSILDKAFRGEL
jgi:type I restriction enzyme, S subunit